MRLAWKRKVSRKGATARYPREWKIVLKFIPAVRRRLAACKERETIRGGSSWKQQARNASNYHSRMEGVLKWSKDGAKMARHQSAFRIIVGCRKTAQADLHHQRRIPVTMSKPLELEFVLVSSDYATMNAVSGAVKKYGGKFILVPTADAAHDCLNRRKIDGVFVDLEVPGALGVIEGIRKGTSNAKAVIFGCVSDSKEYTLALSAGANFLLRKPLNEDSIALHITITKELLERERQRYFRHAVNLPVILNDGEVEQHARMTNLSKAGMAVRTAKALKFETKSMSKNKRTEGLALALRWTGLSEKTKNQIQIEQPAAENQ